jgi:hypothetical protein
LIFKKAKSAEMANTIRQLGAPELKLNTDELTDCLFDKIKESWETTPSTWTLIRLFQTYYDTSMIEWLCQQGADVNAIKPAPNYIFSEDSTYTLLMWAVYKGNKSIMKILCEFDADIEKQTNVVAKYWGQKVKTLSAGDLLRDNPIYTTILNELVQKAEKKVVRTIHCFFQQITTDISTPALEQSVPSLAKGVEDLIYSYCGFGVSHSD